MSNTKDLREKNNRSNLLTIMDSLDTILNRDTQRILDTKQYDIIDLYNRSFCDDLRDLILSANIAVTSAENATRPKEARLPVPKALNAKQVAMIVFHATGIKLARLDEGETLLLKMRAGNGPFKGKWNGLYYAYDPRAKRTKLGIIIDNLTSSKPVKENEVVRFLFNLIDNAPDRTNIFVNYSPDPHLISFPNGVLDLETKVFTPWDDPGYDNKYGHLVFLAYGCGHPYVRNPPQPLHTLPDGTNISPEDVFDAFFGSDPVGIASQYALLYMIYFTMRRITGGEGHVGIAIDKGHGGSGKSTFAAILSNIIQPDPDVNPDTLYDDTNGDTVLHESLAALPERFTLGGRTMVLSLMISDEKDGDGELDIEGFLKRLARGEKHSAEVKYGARYAKSFKNIFLFYMQNGDFYVSNKQDSMFVNLLILVFPNNHRKNGKGDERVRNHFVLTREFAQYVVSKMVIDSLQLTDDYPKWILDALQQNVDSQIKSNLPTMDFFEEVMEKTSCRTLGGNFLYNGFEHWSRFHGINIRIDSRRLRDDARMFCDKHADEYEFIDRKGYYTQEDKASMGFGSNGVRASIDSNSKKVLLNGTYVFKRPGYQQFLFDYGYCEKIKTWLECIDSTVLDNPSGDHSKKILGYFNYHHVFGSWQWAIRRKSQNATSNSTSV